MSGGNISDGQNKTSGRGTGKWESRFHKQVEANNLLSEKLRLTRANSEKIFQRSMKAYSMQMTELIKAKARVAELEKMLGSDD